MVANMADSVEPALARKQRWAATEFVRAHGVGLKVERIARHFVSGRSLRLAHLHSANRRILIGVEIVRAPVVREAEIAIQLRRTETSAEADVEAGNESGRGDGGMPRVAEVDHLLRRCRRCNALEVAPHHYSWRHAYVRRLRGRGAAVTR